MHMLYRAQTTGLGIPFRMLLASDHRSPATGLAPTLTKSEQGAAFAATAGAVTEIANGYYKWVPTVTDLNFSGLTVIRAVAATADDAYVEIQVVPWDPYSGANLGLTCLPTANAGAVNGLPRRGTGDGQFNSTGGKVEITDANITRLLEGVALTEAYPADGDPGTLAGLLYLILANLSQFDVAGTSLVARKLNGVTAAASYLLNDPVNPTSRERVS